MGQYDGHSLFYRHKNGDNGTWLPWKRILTDYDYTSILNNTYLPLTGGTMTGTINWPGNVIALNFRADHSSYNGTVAYQTTGDEALVFSTKQLVTSFIFINGEDTITNNSYSRWTSLTSPGLQIKNNCVSIGTLWGSGVTPDYRLKVTGNTFFNGKMQINGPVIGYNYANGTYRAAFVWDKPGPNLTGVGACGESDTIFFSASDGDGIWNKSYKQKCKFNGDIIADNITANTSINLPGGYVKKHVNGIYTNLGDYYNSGSTAAYIRINLQTPGTYWCMMAMECTIRQSYSDGQMGKLLIYANHWSGQQWTAFKAVYNGTLTSNIRVYGSDQKYIYISGIPAWGGVSVDRMMLGDAAYWQDLSNVIIDGVNSLPSTYQTASIYRSWTQGDSVTGAVWNDYAEYRESDFIEPGYCLIENGNDTLSKSTERMQSWAGISSDTWGFAQGQTEKAQTPIAVAGRVLVYPYRNRNEYKSGDCVCTAPDGKVDIMTEEEIYRHPDKIIGVVSCVPDYEEWGGGENADRPSVKVNGRIWVRVK